MNAIVRDLYRKMQGACFHALQAHDVYTRKTLCREVVRLMETTFDLWGVTNSRRRRDADTQQAMELFWRQTLESCMPEMGGFAHCPEPFVLSNAVRIHAVFFVVGEGYKGDRYSLHVDEVFFYAENIDKTCRELLAPKQPVVVHKPLALPKPQNPLPRHLSEDRVVLSLANIVANRRNKA